MGNELDIATSKPVETPRGDSEVSTHLRGVYNRVVEFDICTYCIALDRRARCHSSTHQILDFGLSNVSSDDTISEYLQGREIISAHS